MIPRLHPIDLGPLSARDERCMWLFDIPPEWIDYNDHLGARYYAAIFIEALSQSMDKAGLGRHYASEGYGTFVAIEATIRYFSEVRLEKVQVSTRILNWDHKRLSWQADLYVHASMRLASTYNMTAVHIDQASRKAKPIPAALLNKLVALHPENEPSISG